MAIGIKKSSTTQRGNPLGRVVEWRWGLLTLWLGASALFLGRAIAGRFDRPLSSVGLIAVVMVVVVLTLAIRSLLRGSMANSIALPQTAGDWFAQALPTLAAIFLAVGFTVAGAHVTGLVFLWILVAAEVLLGAAGPWTLALLQRWLGRSEEDRGTIVLDHPRGTINDAAPAPSMVQEQQAAQIKPLIAELTNDLDEETGSNEELPWLWQDDTALQELRYMTLPEIGMCVAGSQRALLAAAQLTAVVHTVFYPPFAAPPLITIELQEPETVAIKAAQILPQGVRWELRAEQLSDKPREVRWAFTATSKEEVDPDPSG